MATTTAQYMNAKGDMDLLSRFIAKAELMGIEDASSKIQASYRSLITTPVQDGQSAADVYAYAAETRETYIKNTPPAPGLNPGAVTDAHLETAINAVLNPA